MRQFLLLAVVLAAAALALLAFVFRNPRALHILKTLRNAVWLYIGLVFLLAALELARRLT